MPIDDTRIRQALWRAHHRGTREADMMVGGFADRYLRELTEEELEWFERLMEEQDVDIMAWAFKQQPIPADLDGPMMERLCRLDYLTLPKR